MLRRTVQRTPPRSTALPSPTHRSTCKEASEYSLMADSLNWTGFAHLIYTDMVYMGQKQTNTRVHFNIFKSTAICLHMSHPHIQAPSRLTQNDTNSIISARSYLPLPAVCSWQLSPLHAQPVFRSSLFGSCVVHISVTTIMSPANLYHFVSRDQTEA